MYRLRTEISRDYYYADAVLKDVAIGMIRFDFSDLAVLSNVEAYGSMYFRNEFDFRGMGVATILLMSGLLNVAERGFQDFYGTLLPTPHYDSNSRDNALKFYKKMGVEFSRNSGSRYDLIGSVARSTSICHSIASMDKLILSNNFFRLKTTK